MKEKQFVKVNKKRVGFTLIELVVVVVILGVLSVIAVPKVFDQIDRSNYAVDVANAKIIFDTMNMGIVAGEIDGKGTCVKGLVKEYPNGFGAGKIIKSATSRMSSIPTTRYKNFLEQYYLDLTIDKQVIIYALRFKPTPKYIQVYPNPVSFEELLD